MTRFFLYIWFIIISLTSCTPTHTKCPIAILGAMPEEIALLVNEMTDVDTVYINDYTYYEGNINQEPIVISLCGIGKVNAAISTSLIIQNYKPSMIIMTGIAGAIDGKYQPGDVVIAKACVQHDFGLLTNNLQVWATTNPNTQKDNPLWLNCDSLLYNKAYRQLKNKTLSEIHINQYSHTPQLYIDSIASGDQFIASTQRKDELETLGAGAVEMEGAAVAQACTQLSTPLLLIRAISDQADSEPEFTYTELKPHVAQLSAQLVLDLLMNPEFTHSME